MFRNCLVIIGRNLSSKSSYQFEQHAYYHIHSHSLRQSLKSNSRLVIDGRCILLRKISSSSALLDAAGKNVSEASTFLASSPIEPITDSSSHASAAEAAVATAAESARATAEAASAAAPVNTFEVSTDALLEAATTTKQTLADLGLGSSTTPVGWVQNALDLLHESSGLPWWGCIVLSTITIRTFMFPVFVVTQRNMAHMTKYLPLTQELHHELTLARQRGDHLEASRLSNEMHLFMKEKGVNPFKQLSMPMLQAPVFLCFFLGLRNMANAPLDSMRDGGMLWFVDLTVPDQFYLLPLLTSATLFVTLEIGAEFGKIQSNMGPIMKWGFRALPVVIFPFTLHFPAAILVYWTTTNTFSLVQTCLLKIPGAKQKLGIPNTELVKKKMQKEQKGFVEEVKSSWSNMKVVQELRERERIDQLQFNRAGREAPIKTYKYDPTQVRTIKAKPASKS